MSTCGNCGIKFLLQFFVWCCDIYAISSIKKRMSAHYLKSVTQTKHLHKKNKTIPVSNLRFGGNCQNYCFVQYIFTMYLCTARSFLFCSPSLNLYIESICGSSTGQIQWWNTWAVLLWRLHTRSVANYSHK